jgi:hypothetical protein
MGSVDAARVAGDDRCNCGGNQKQQTIAKAGYHEILLKVDHYECNVVGLRAFRPSG